MKKLTILSIVTASVLLVGCGEDSKKAASDATAKAVETSKEAVHNAADATKEATAKAIEATKKAAAEAAEAAKEATAKAVEATKEAATATKEAASNAVDKVEKAAGDAVANTEGKALFAKCSGCHGVDGKTKALGKSAVIAGEPKEDIVAKLNAYKAGTRNVAGMGMLMKGQVASLDDKSIAAVAAYISVLK